MERENLIKNERFKAIIRNLVEEVGFANDSIHGLIGEAITYENTIKNLLKNIVVHRWVIEFKYSGSGPDISVDGVKEFITIELYEIDNDILINLVAEYLRGKNEYKTLDIQILNCTRI